MRTARPLWQCPRCGRRFANRNQAHSCGQYALRPHLEGKREEVVRLYERLVAMVRRCGPVKIVPTKTQIVFQARMGFAGVHLRKGWIDVGLLLARRLEHPRFAFIATVSPRNHLHRLRIRSAAELDDQVQAWLEEAYQVGEQKHLARRG